MLNQNAQYILTLLLMVTIAALGAGCSTSNDFADSPSHTNDESKVATRKVSAIASTPLATAATDGRGPRFEELNPKEIGIDFVNEWSPPDQYKSMIAHSSSGAGVTVGDIDGDGLPDIYFPRSFGGGQLYRNKGNFRFENVTGSAGLGDDKGWGSGATFVDIDNDSDLDLYVCGFDCPNRLYVNDGSGRFTEQAAQFGLDFNGASIMMSFADYDRDGDLDGMLVANRHSTDGYQVGTMKEANAVASRVKVVDGRAVFPPELVEKYSLIVRGRDQARIIKAGQFARLFQNDGSGKFVDVARQSGIRDNGLTLSATWWDYNEDGWPDLYLANDFFGPDRLYRNDENGTFTEVTGDVLPHTPWMSMGTDIGDLNNDGRIDFFATDMSGTSHYNQKLGMGDMSANGWFLEMGRPRQYMRNAVYLNTGVDHVMEVAHMMGVSNSDWTWSPKLGDLDNDGDLDVFITNGVSGDWNNSDLMKKLGHLPVDEMLAKVPPKMDENLAFENVGGLQFKKASKTWGLNKMSRSYGAALADLDNDGDLDILTNDFDAAPLVYRNRSAEAHRVKISLQGQSSNRFGVGARIELTAGGQTQVRSLTLARGFMSTNEPVVYFGLGKNTTIDQLVIQWPSGHRHTFDNLTADQHYTITEPAGKAEVNSVEPAAPEPLFTDSDHRLKAAEEQPFDDFARQPLLPNQLSSLGPAMAVGDIDKDGDDDLFIAGPAGSAGTLYANQEGRFRHVDSGPFAEAAASEDMGALFFDADGDRDLDLYVVSGGVECEPNDDLLADRLYLNDGQGKFSLAAADVLPGLRNSGGCIAAADVDHDGDLDLFVGGRVIPGQYPRTPDSVILINESTNGELKFIDGTAEIAPEIAQTGLVTSAVWSDVDSDGWIDLMVTHEWGPIKVFRNEDGKLTNVAGESGLKDATGWWNGIAGGDIDNDGDMDFVVSNFGLNTKYHVSAENPAVIYFNDFNKPGDYRIVEAHLDGQSGKMVPVRGRSCSSNAMPFIAKKCETYHEFAIAELSEIYTKKDLSESLKVEANTLESMLLLNDGQGRFSMKPLPRIAQVAPGFGVTMLDVNADANLDIVFAQNFFGPQRETGRMDGGLSLLMLGDGKGSFQPLSPVESGIAVTGDAKSLVVTDVNSDRVPDLIVGKNNDRPQILLGRSDLASKFLRVKPQTAGVGARVTAVYRDGTMQGSEIGFGSGYMSQSTNTLWYGVEDSPINEVLVQWPDGSRTTVPVQNVADETLEIAKEE